MSECMCEGCPFDFCSEYSCMAQDYGCLPTPYEIRDMRVKHGKTWACHSEPTTPCIGAIQWLKEKGLPYKVIDDVLVTEQDPWHLYCE